MNSNNDIWLLQWSFTSCISVKKLCYSFLPTFQEKRTINQRWLRIAMETTVRVGWICPLFTSSKKWVEEIPRVCHILFLFRLLLPAHQKFDNILCCIISCMLQNWKKNIPYQEATIFESKEERKISTILNITDFAWKWSQNNTFG